MESSPEQLNTWDMADLSQLPADEFPDDVSGASGPGPVRRRKTSLRANPFASGPDSSLPRLRMQAFNAADMPLSPHTPTSQTFNPFEIHFHDLLPVFPSCDMLTNELRD
jgi:hypothetical protein